MNAAMVRVKVAMASCIICTVVSRSFTTVVIDTFITVPSSTMMNWASPSTMIAVHFFTRATIPVGRPPVGR